MQKPITLVPLERGLECVWSVPGSKSITNRALVLAALADGTTILRNALHSNDTVYMRQCLGQLGITCEELSKDEWRISGGKHRLQAPAAPLFVGNSGTTVRFLTGLCCLVPGRVHLTGNQHMAKRPIADLVEALTQLNVDVKCATGCPPLTLQGGWLPGGTITMRGNKSSQYFSAILMAGAGADAKLTVCVQGSLVSLPYVQMTCSMIKHFGGTARIGEKKLEETNNITQRLYIEPAVYRACDYNIEPDASAASYAFAAAAALGGSITVPGLVKGDCLQGDVNFVDILEQMGCTITSSNTSQGKTTTVHGPPEGKLQGVDVDMHHISDTVMSLAAIAPLAHGVTTIRNIANIRIKETDRLIALVNELRKLGQGVEYGEDWLRITPRPITPAVIHCYADHRIAMSFAVLGLAAPGVTIEDPKCVNKTYPGFWEDLAKLYAQQSKSVPWARL